MQITLFSFFISGVWGSMLAVVIYLCRKSRFFIYHAGLTSMVLLYLSYSMRMILPLDFAFTQGISSGGLFSDVYDQTIHIL